MLSCGFLSLVEDHKKNDSKPKTQWTRLKKWYDQDGSIVTLSGNGSKSRRDLRFLGQDWWGK